MGPLESDHGGGLCHHVEEGGDEGANFDRSEAEGRVRHPGSHGRSLLLNQYSLWLQDMFKVPVTEAHFDCLPLAPPTWGGVWDFEGNLSAMVPDREIDLNQGSLRGASSETVVPSPRSLVQKESGGLGPVVLW